MSGNYSTTDDSLGAGSVTPPGNTAPELEDLLIAAERARDEAIDERDRITERVAELVGDGNELRAELAEVRKLAGDLERDRNALLAGRDELREYREYDGDLPAVAFAGTEHLADQITRLVIPDEES